MCSGVAASVSPSPACGCASKAFSEPKFPRKWSWTETMSIGFMGYYKIRAVSVLNIKLSALNYLIIAIYLLILMRVV